MTTNVNPETGIAYGYIASAAMDLDVVQDLIHGDGCTEFHNISYDEYMAQCRAKYLEEHEERLAGMTPEERDAELEDMEEEFCQEYEPCEEIVEGKTEGVHFRSSWLGGALNFFIFESPHVTGRALRASPCVPGAGILDTLDGDVQCYDVPPDWRPEEEPMDLTHYCERMLVISTGHLPGAVARGLTDRPDDMAVPVPFFDREHYGWMFALCGLEELKEQEVEDTPPELLRLLEFAHENGFEWLLLDRDAASLPSESGLPTFDW